MKQYTTIPEKQEGILLNVSIKQKANGLFNLIIREIETNDNYASQVFFSDENDNVSVRKIIGGHYEITNENKNEGVTSIFNENFDSFDLAKNKAVEMLNEIENARKIIRANKHEEEFYVSI